MARASKKQRRDSVGKVRGVYRLWVLDSEGRIADFRESENIVVGAARGLLADLLRGSSALPLGAMAVGTSATAPTSADVTLTAEVGRAAVPAPGTNTAAAKNLRSGAVVTIRQTIGPLTATINEAGMFGGIASPPGAANSGILFNHSLIGPVVLAAATIVVESQLTFL